MWGYDGLEGLEEMEEEELMQTAGPAAAAGESAGSAPPQHISPQHSPQHSPEHSPQQAVRCDTPIPSACSAPYSSAGYPPYGSPSSHTGAGQHDPYSTDEPTAGDPQPPAAAPPVGGIAPGGVLPAQQQYQPLCGICGGPGPLAESNGGGQYCGICWSSYPGPCVPIGGQPRLPPAHAAAFCAAAEGKPPAPHPLTFYGIGQKIELQGGKVREGRFEHLLCPRRCGVCRECRPIYEAIPPVDAYRGVPFRIYRPVARPVHRVPRAPLAAVPGKHVLPAPRAPPHAALPEVAAPSGPGGRSAAAPPPQREQGPQAELRRLFSQLAKQEEAVAATWARIAELRRAPAAAAAVHQSRLASSGGHNAPAAPSPPLGRERSGGPDQAEPVGGPDADAAGGLDAAEPGAAPTDGEIPAAAVLPRSPQALLGSPAEVPPGDCPAPGTPAPVQEDALAAAEFPPPVPAAEHGAGARSLLLSADLREREPRRQEELRSRQDEAERRGAEERLRARTDEEEQRLEQRRRELERRAQEEDRRFRVKELDFEERLARAAVTEETRQDWVGLLQAVDEDRRRSAKLAVDTQHRLAVRRSELEEGELGARAAVYRGAVDALAALRETKHDAFAALRHRAYDDERQGRSAAEGAEVSARESLRAELRSAPALRSRPLAPPDPAPDPEALRREISRGQYTRLEADEEGERRLVAERERGRRDLVQFSATQGLMRGSCRWRSAPSSPVSQPCPSPPRSPAASPVSPAALASPASQPSESPKSPKSPRPPLRPPPQDTIPRAENSARLEVVQGEAAEWGELSSAEAASRSEAAARGRQRAAAAPAPAAAVPAPAAGDGHSSSASVSDADSGAAPSQPAHAPARAPFRSAPQPAASPGSDGLNRQAPPSTGGPDEAAAALTLTPEAGLGLAAGSKAAAATAAAEGHPAAARNPEGSPLLQQQPACPVTTLTDGAGVAAVGPGGRLAITDYVCVTRWEQRTRRMLEAEISARWAEWRGRLRELREASQLDHLCQMVQLVDQLIAERGPTTASSAAAAPDRKLAALPPPPPGSGWGGDGGERRKPGGLPPLLLERPLFTK